MRIHSDIMSVQVYFLPSVPIFEIEYHAECSTDDPNGCYNIVCDGQTKVEGHYNVLWSTIWWNAI